VELEISAEMPVRHIVFPEANPSFILPLLIRLRECIEDLWPRTRSRTLTADDFIGSTGVASSFVAHVRCSMRVMASVDG